MNPEYIDLRSDTVTKPTPQMRQFIAEADVGDDVHGEDPTINRLQQEVAALLGKETALYVPSGTMSNQLAVRLHTQPGDELLCEQTCHIYNWEAGGPAVLSQVTCRTICGDSGILDAADFEGKIRPDNEHYVRTRLICLENTHNRGGGKIFPIDKIERISQWARDNGLRMHLDGARLMNAVVASGVAAKEYAKHFDTVSMCFSKGLGAPIGSALVGSEALIRRAYRLRKVFGGATRQGGIAAAGALFAINHNVDRLSEDHQNARRIAEAIKQIDGLKINSGGVDTNIIWCDVDRQLGTSAAIAAAMQARGVRIGIDGSATLRFVTHLDATGNKIDRVIAALSESVAEVAASTEAEPDAVLETW